MKWLMLISYIIIGYIAWHTISECFILTEIAKGVIEILDQTTINQYLQKCSAKITSGLRSMAANKVLNSDLSNPSSVYNRMSIGNSISHNY